MADFKHSKNTPQPRGERSRSADEQGGAPATGFTQAPKSGEKGDGGPGPAVPPSNHKIR